MAKDLMTTRKMQIGQVAPVLGDTYVDVAANLSRLNHKLYRQGMTYMCKVDLEPTSAQTVDVYALRPNWITKRAWQLAFETYLNSTADERAMAKAQGLLGKWSDFRIDIAAEGAGAGLPFKYSHTRASSVEQGGEFANSVVGNPDVTGDEMTFTAVTAGTSTIFNIFGEFDVGYRPPVETTDSEVPTDVAYDGLTASADVNAEEYENLIDNGNLPPYPRSIEQEASPFIKIGQLKVGAGNGAQGTGKLTTGYFAAPLGLIVLEQYAPANIDAADVIVEVQSGDYKGVNAMPLGVAKKVGKNEFKVI